MKKEMICIVCPVGCHLTADENNNVTGNKCPRGKTYAIREMTDPRRVLTTSVRTVWKDLPRLSVKSRDPIPKGLMFDIMERLSRITVDRPVHIGDVIVEDVLGTGIDIVSTNDVFLRYNGTKGGIR